MWYLARLASARTIELLAGSATAHDRPRDHELLERDDAVVVGVEDAEDALLQEGIDEAHLLHDLVELGARHLARRILALELLEQCLDLAHVD